MCVAVAARKDFDDLGGQEVHLVHRVVAHQQAGLCAVLQDDEHAAVHQQGHVAAQDVDELDGLLHDDAAGDVEQHAVLGKGGVEGGQPVARRVGQGAEVSLHQFGIVAEVAQDDAVGQRLFRVGEGVVHHEEQRGAHVGHVALEHFVGIDGDGQPLEVHAVVRLEGAGHVGVLAVFLPAGGEAQPLEVGEGTGAQAVQRLGAVGAQQGFRLGV